jgi:hypothetical protein
MPKTQATNAMNQSPETPRVVGGGGDKTKLQKERQ